MNAADWNERYAAEHYFYGEAPNAFLVEKPPYIPAGPVLCLAEGEGCNAVHLATLGHRVTAVDQSEAGLAKAPASRRLVASRLRPWLPTWKTSPSSRVFGLESSQFLRICHRRLGAKFTRRRRGVSVPAGCSFSKPIPRHSWNVERGGQNPGTADEL